MKRIERIKEKFFETFPESGRVRFFSAPGRTEIGGNHTDHNHGCVLAGAVDLDILAACSPTEDGKIHIQSEGFEGLTVDLENLSLRTEEYGKDSALVRGICAEFLRRGYFIGGFCAYTASLVPTGSGLSSSAAFEVLIATILNTLYNGGRISPLEIAQIAQYAENVYFGKPCGLMDQITCSFGGLISIDFKASENPVVTPIDFDFEKSGHKICIVNTKGNHADLTEEYKSIKDEMGLVAEFFGKEYLRQVEEDEFYRCFGQLTAALPSRAVLRAYHFFNENKRVQNQVRALGENHFQEFLKQIRESGFSSYMYNQNIYSPGNASEQPLALALAFSQSILKERGGFRIHGGGFAGTIQAFVPNDLLDEYRVKIEGVFGEGACIMTTIRSFGAKEITFDG